MKWLGLVIVLLCSCNKRVHIYQTMTSFSDIRQPVFENDTVRIAYNFWADNGQVSFEVFNKLSLPLYLDWKQSSFIRNGDRFNYWEDFTITATAHRSAPTIYRYERVSAGVSVSVKPEQVSFIPPQSTIYKSQYMIQPGIDATFSSNARKITIDLPLRNRLIVALERSFNKSTSPVVFRNFMTFATISDFSNRFFVDNEFFVSSIVEMKYKTFRGNYPDVGKGTHQVSDFMSPGDFYLLAGSPLEAEKIFKQ